MLKTDRYVGSISRVSVEVGERCEEKNLKKKLSVSFMYVCVAENGEMLVIFSYLFPNNSLIDNSLSE